MAGKGKGKDPNKTTPPNRAREFAFVNESTPSEARKHAMRDHWKRRHKRNEEAKIKAQKKSLRTLLPLGEGRRSDSLQSADPSSSSSSLHGGSRGSSADKTRDRRTDIAAQLLSSLSGALSSSRPDPFQTCPIHLTVQNQKLLYHWITVHATMMFEELDVAEFNPMKDVWFPLDLSNASSFNCIMAHSAAHLGQLYSGTPPQRATTSSDALKYKAEAVKLLRSWLADPDKELNDDSFAAVVRLLTFERYWGAARDWQIHRDGLQRMIDAKGGVHALQDNWRLELVVYLVSLMSRPTWFESANNLEEMSHPPVSEAIIQQSQSFDLQKVRCLWLISFIQDMRTFMGCFYTRGLSSFPSTHAAVGLLRRSFLQYDKSQSPDAQITPWEYDMLQCLFSISVLMQESTSAIDDGNWVGSGRQMPLDELELFLGNSMQNWQESAQSLRSILFESLKRLTAEGELKLRYVVDMVKVLATLSLEARQGVAKCLLNMLYCLGGNNCNVPFLVDDGWTPDSLLSLMHGH